MVAFLAAGDQCSSFAIEVTVRRTSWHKVWRSREPQSVHCLIEGCLINPSAKRRFLRVKQGALRSGGARARSNCGSRAHERVAPRDARRDEAVVQDHGVVTMIGILVAILIAAPSADNFDAPRAWTLVAVVASAYMVARGLAKSGSRHVDSDR